MKTELAMLANWEQAAIGLVFYGKDALVKKIGFGLEQELQ